MKTFLVRTCSVNGSLKEAEISLARAVKSLTGNKKPVFVCIGTDAVTGDSLGPLTGTVLSEKLRGKTYVLGTLDRPLTALDVNIASEFVKKVYPYGAIVAVDAALGRKEEVGSVLVSDSPVKPGLGVKKELNEIGDVSVVESAAGDGYYVVVFLAREDNHYPTVSARHILIRAEADENGAYTDEAKQAALARINEIKAEFESGDKTEESFAALAEQYSEDAGSNTNGGLYENIYKWQMVPEFDAFCFAGHKSGDIDVVYGENSGYAGYHLVYFVGEGDLYSNVIAENALLSDAVNAFVEEHIEGYEPVLRFWSRYAGR